MAVATGCWPSSGRKVIVPPVIALPLKVTVPVTSPLPGPPQPTPSNSSDGSATACSTRPPRAALRGEGGPPSGLADAARNEPDAAVAHADVDAPGVRRVGHVAVGAVAAADPVVVAAVAAGVLPATELRLDHRQRRHPHVIQ